MAIGIYLLMTLFFDLKLYILFLICLFSTYTYTLKVRNFLFLEELVVCIYIFVTSCTHILNFLMI